MTGIRLQLGIIYPTLEKIKENNRENFEQCKKAMIAAWLNKEYDVDELPSPKKHRRYDRHI